MQGLGVSGFEAAGTVDAVGPGVTSTSIGDGVTALLFGLGGYADRPGHRPYDYSDDYRWARHRTWPRSVAMV